MAKFKIPAIADFAAILLFSCAVLSGLIFSGNWPQSHDGIRYLCHLDQFKDAFESGILYPRWLPNYYGGYGYPVFLFYQPGYFFLSLIFTCLTPDILAASYASCAAMFFLGGAGVYLLIRKISGERPMALFCSVMFILTPYVFVNIYVRGDLSELLAMFVAPWPLYFLIILKERIAGRSAFIPFSLVLSFTLAAMVYSHPFTSMFFYPLFCVISLSLCLEMEKRCRVIFLSAVAVAMTFAVVLSSPYWLTAFQMKQYINYASAVTGVYSAADHVVYLQQLFSRTWGFGDSNPGAADGMSFQLGLPHFILALLGFWLNRRNKFYFTVFLIYIFCIIAMTPVASFFWKHVPLLNYVQFPWRLLGVISLLQIICISGLCRIGPLVNSNTRFISILAFILILSLIWYSNQFQFVKCKFDLRKGIIANRTLRLDKLEVYESSNEYLPRTASKYLPPRARGMGPMIEVSDPNCKVEEYPDSNPHHMQYRISSAAPQMIVINQLYFPGFKVYLGDKALDDRYLRENMTRDGRIQIGIPAGPDQFLEVFYEGPPGWYLRNCLIASVLVAMLALVVLEQKKKLKIFPD